MKKSTKIICTIGPKTSTQKILKKLYKAGMNGIRINTAHGYPELYQKVINNARTVSDVPIILDIKGPELRIRTKKEVSIARNEEFWIGPNEDVRFNFNIYERIDKGDVILLKDGRYKLKTISTKKHKIQVKAREKITITPNMNVNIPDKTLRLSRLTKKDLESIQFAKKLKVEYIALSFCRNKEDILNLRRKLKDTDIKIIAKIENKEGIENITEIISSADGVMVARGDLGVELPQEQVPIVQKEIINQCNNLGKLVIVATQMLETMVENSTPTRAEVSDIANAVLDGADCLMLSEETAIGKHPVESVKQMARVAMATEPYIYSSDYKSEREEISEQISASAVGLVNSLPISKIICLTKSGYTAINITKYRVKAPVIAVTHTDTIRRQLMLYFAIEPVIYGKIIKQSVVKVLTHFLEKKKIISPKDLILFTAGLHGMKGKHTNTIQIVKASDILEK